MSDVGPGRAQRGPRPRQRHGPRPTETWPQAKSDVAPSHLKHGPAGPTVSSLLSYSGPMPGTTQVPVEARRYVEHDNVCLVSTSVT